MNFNVELIISDPFRALFFFKCLMEGYISLRYLICAFLKSDLFNMNRFHRTSYVFKYLSSLTVIHASFHQSLFPYLSITSRSTLIIISFALLIKIIFKIDNFLEIRKNGRLALFPVVIQHLKHRGCSVKTMETDSGFFERDLISELLMDCSSLTCVKRHHLSSVTASPRANWDFTLSQ